MEDNNHNMDNTNDPNYDYSYDIMQKIPRNISSDNHVTNNFNKEFTYISKHRNVYEEHSEIGLSGLNTPLNCEVGVPIQRVDPACI